MKISFNVSQPGSVIAITSISIYRGEYKEFDIWWDHEDFQWLGHEWRRVTKDSKGKVITATDNELHQTIEAIFKVKVFDESLFGPFIPQEF
jgi:hypothetical protein